MLLTVLKVCVCKSICTFRDLLERINNMRVEPDRAAGFIVTFLPCVLVPAGRSCFGLPNFTGLKSSSCQSKDAGQHKYLSLN